MFLFYKSTSKIYKKLNAKGKQNRDIRSASPPSSPYGIQKTINPPASVKIFKNKLKN